MTAVADLAEPVMQVTQYRITEAGRVAYVTADRDGEWWDVSVACRHELTVVNPGGGESGGDYVARRGLAGRIRVGNPAEQDGQLALAVAYARDLCRLVGEHDERLVAAGLATSQALTRARTRAGCAD